MTHLENCNNTAPTAWLSDPIATPSEPHRQRALQRQSQLTKPAGSLGRLEALAVQLAALQHTDRPAAERAHIAIFAADHGIAAEGVSAFPQAVTAQMLANFATGGAAIAVLARSLNAPLTVVNLGTVAPIPNNPDIVSRVLGAGTANFAMVPAMNADQLAAALRAGAEQAERAHASGCEVFIGGDMGIANSSAATALACALLKLPAADLAGPGTGLDKAGVHHKAAVIDAALARHSASALSPLALMQAVGGFEIAALAGSFLRCAQLGIPVLLDGFICSAAALWAQRNNPALQAWLLLSHRSAEPGHARIADALQLTPLLDLQLRLGEASGAAVALPLLRLACALHNGMATFAEAAVSDRNDD